MLAVCLHLLTSFLWFCDFIFFFSYLFFISFLLFFFSSILCCGCWRCYQLCTKSNWSFIKWCNSYFLCIYECVCLSIFVEITQSITIAVKSWYNVGNEKEMEIKYGVSDMICGIYLSVGNRYRKTLYPIDNVLCSIYELRTHYEQHEIPTKNSHMKFFSLSPRPLFPPPSRSLVRLVSLSLSLPANTFTLTSRSRRSRSSLLLLSFSS